MCGIYYITYIIFVNVISLTTNVFKEFQQPWKVPKLAYVPRLSNA